jgi:hypothetical protein
MLSSFYGPNLPFPVQKAKDRKKKSRLFSFFVKPHPTCVTRIILTILFFRGKTSTEKRNPDKKEKKLLPEALHLRETGAFPPYFALGRIRSAPGDRI